MNFIKHFFCGLINGHDHVMRWTHYGPKHIRTTYVCSRCGHHSVVERPRKNTP